MKIKFLHDFPIAESLCFEKVYPENLQFEEKDKQDLKDEGAKFITMIDEDTGNLIGESYYIALDAMRDWPADEEQMEDGLEPWYGKNCVYIYSTTILPEYQRNGFGSILKAYVLGLITKEGYCYVLGHARVNGSIQLNELFGAKREQPFQNWYETGETYFLYSLGLDENIQKEKLSKELGGKYPLAKMIAQRNKLKNETI